MWPNPFYQEEESRAAHAPFRVTIALDKSFGAEVIREALISLVPSIIPPGYPTLSPQPPTLTPLPTSETSSENQTELEQEAVLPIPMPILT